MTCAGQELGPFSACDVTNRDSERLCDSKDDDVYAFQRNAFSDWTSVSSKQVDKFLFSAKALTIIQVPFELVDELFGLFACHRGGLLQYFA